MKISAVICTYNQCASLKETLESLLHQECNGDFNYEIIVVDNNSNDKTKKAVADYKQRFNGRLRYAYEPNQGLSYARNRGIGEAKGEIVTFTDDDCIVSSNWLESIFQTFKSKDCDAMGGKIVLKFLQPPPRWLSKRFYGNLAGLDYGDKGFWINSAKQRFFGANFAVKRDILQQVNGFNVLLGPKGKKPINKDDIDMFNKLFPRHRIYYQPDSVVYHKTGPQRLKKSYFRRWYFYEAQGAFFMNPDSHRAKKSRQVFGIPLWLIKELILSTLQFMKSKLRGKEGADELFFKELMIRYYAGLIVAAYKMRRQNLPLKTLFLPNFGGNPYLALLAKGLKENQVEVEIAPYQKLFGWPSLLKTALKYKDFNIIHLHWISPYIYRLCRGKSRIKTAIKLFFYAIDILLVKALGRKIVWTIHNKFTHESQNKALERRFRRMLVSFSNRVLVHSPSASAELKKAYAIKSSNHFSVISQGSYVGIYPNSITKEAARKQLGLKAKQKVYLYFGSIRPYKGLDESIKQFKQNKALQEAVLLIAGAPRSEKLRMQIERMTRDVKNIKLILEFIPEEKVQVLMNAADVVVFPFREILNSGSVILAMSFAKAVIAPRKGNLIDLLDKKGAFFFADDQSLQEAILKALDDSELKLRGSHNLEVIRQYRWDKMAEQLKTIYQKVK